jgi:hypothetical protein
MSKTNMKGKNNGKKGTSVVPRSLVASSQMFEKLYERSSSILETTAVGGLSLTVASVSPASLISAAHLTGYQAIRDECRIDRVRVSLYPIFSGTTSGRVALYLERDSAASISASYDLAQEQLELAFGRLTDPLVLEWHPQEPLDREFQTLNPGTRVHANYFIVADALAANGAPLAINYFVFEAIVETWATLRGRPN